MLLGADIFQYIAEETNLYAQQQGATQFHVDASEIAAFTGVNIAMGVINLPSIHDYWSINPILRHPWFSTIMSRNRFYDINRYLHFNDNSLQVSRDHPAFDKLYKIRPVLERVQKTFTEHYTPSMNVSIDEQMLGTKARISFLQYLPKKPQKWGVKLWVLADSMNGYVPAFDIYTGASDGAEHGLAYNVVMKLMEGYLYEGRRLYVDNYYTSPRLFLDLEDRGTYACGTVRANRKGLPNESHSLERGGAVFKKCKCTLTFVHWKDKRDVLCLSTFHGNSMEDYTTRRRDAEDIQRPSLISEYNKNMGGVDHLDQYLVYYALGRKTIKWYKRIFWRIIEMALINAFVLYNLCHPDAAMSQKKFRLELADALVEDFVNEKANAESPITSPGRKSKHHDRRLHGKHFATLMKKKGRCAVCGNKKKPNGQRKDTKVRNYCAKCKVYLCRGECFKKYHTKYKF